MQPMYIFFLVFWCLWYVVSFLYTAIKIGRYTHVKRASDCIEVKRLKGEETPNNSQEQEPDVLPNFATASPKSSTTSPKFSTTSHRSSTTSPNSSTTSPKSATTSPKSATTSDQTKFSDVDVDETEVEQLLEKLIAIQEESHDDFRLSFQPGGLLEKQLLVYVCWFIIRLLNWAQFFKNILKIPKGNQNA